jgi:hypothetical protein
MLTHHQIYAGYFLMNFLFLLFCMACRVWHKAKINYVFVFEYDTRHHLDWRQLSEVGSPIPGPAALLTLAASLFLFLPSRPVYMAQLSPSWRRRHIPLLPSHTAFDYCNDFDITATYFVFPQPPMAALLDGT